MTNIGWGWWVLMSIGMVAFWGLLLYALFLLVRGPIRDDNATTPERPEAVLKRRLATGEISLDEYEDLREALRASGAPTAA